MNSALLVEIAHSKYLAAQRLYRFVINLDFDKAVDETSSEEYKLLKELIVKEDLVALKKLIKQILSREIETKTVMELRQLAKDYKIKNWNIITKASLISELKKRMEDGNKSKNVPK